MSDHVRRLFWSHRRYRFILFPAILPDTWRVSQSRPRQFRPSNRCQSLGSRGKQGPNRSLKKQIGGKSEDHATKYHALALAGLRPALNRQTGKGLLPIDQPIDDQAHLGRATAACRCPSGYIQPCGVQLGFHRLQGGQIRSCGQYPQRSCIGIEGHVADGHPLAEGRKGAGDLRKKRQETTRCRPSGSGIPPAEVATALQQKGRWLRRATRPLAPRQFFRARRFLCQAGQDARSAQGRQLRRHPSTSAKHRAFVHNDP